MRRDKSKPLPTRSRKEALAEGALVDVSTAALEVGIRQPTALTRRAWDRYVRIPEGLHGETEDRRLNGLLRALRPSAAQFEARTTVVHFNVWAHDGEEMQYCGLRAVIGRCDDGGPAITVMDSNEK